jgi:DNA polymerase III delta prime subunit
MSHHSADTQEHVFISYARADGSQHARELERVLRLEGFTTWRDVRDLEWSADFTSELENAIKSSLAVVLCVTPDVGRADSFVRREIAFAQLVNRPIIVARFANVPPPISVVNNTYVDFHVSGETALAQLLRFLRQGTFRKVSLPQTARNSYLAALYHEIIDRLDDAILLPVVGRRMQLLEATGMIARSKFSSSGPEVLSSRYFQPARGPVAGIGIRQALDYARQRLAIVGPAGSGKTIALMVLARELASEAITDPDKPLPLLVSAASWEAGGTAEAGLISWLAREVPMLAEAIPDLIRARQVMLLVDGLDELPYLISKSEGAEQRYPRRELVRELPRSCPLVIASRPLEFQAAAADLEISRVFELQPLTDAQVSEFVAQVPVAAAILDQDDALRSAARTPLMLALLCSALDAAGRKEIGHLTPSEARDLIVESYVESRYERECVRHQGMGSAPLSLAELYRRLGSLAMSDASGGGNRNLFSIEEAQAELGHGDAYSLALDTNIMIAIRGGALRFYHLALRDHFAFRYAQDTIHDPDPAIRDSAAWALWQIPDRRAVDLLLEALGDPYPYARGSAASALGRIGDPRAIGPLTKLLTDKTQVVSMYGNTVADAARWAITQIHQSE